MAIVITDGTTGDSGTYTTGGVTEVIASGAFGAASVQIMLSHDGAPPAPIATFSAPGAVSIQAAPGAEITAKIVGGQSPVISVTCNP